MSEPTPPPLRVLKLLFWLGLAAGIGMFAIRLNGNDSMWTGYLHYVRRPR